MRARVRFRTRQQASTVPFTASQAMHKPVPWPLTRSWSKTTTLHSSRTSFIRAAFSQVRPRRNWKMDRHRRARIHQTSTSWPRMLKINMTYWLKLGMRMGKIKEAASSSRPQSRLQRNILGSGSRNQSQASLWLTNRIRIKVQATSQPSLACLEVGPRISWVQLSPFWMLLWKAWLQTRWSTSRTLTRINHRKPNISNRNC